MLFLCRALKCALKRALKRFFKLFLLFLSAFSHKFPWSAKIIFITFAFSLGILSTHSRLKAQAKKGF